MNGVPLSKVCSVSPRLKGHGELARHCLPKRQRRLVLLVVRTEPPPRCSPHHGNQHGRSRMKNPMTSRWRLPTLEHVQANGEPRSIGEGEMRASK